MELSLDKDQKINELVKFSKKNRTTKDMIKSIIKHVALLTVAISMLAPFFWMLSTSLKTGPGALAIPPQWIPDPFVWRNFLDVFQRVPFLRFIWNSTFHSVSVTFLEVGISLIVAYGFARFNFKGKRFLFMFLLMTIMLPGEITIVPGFIYWVQLSEILGIQFIDTYWPMILPAIGGQAVHIFFMTQYFRTISNDFAEAAYINGASNWKILWKIYFPMSLPAIITISISSFMGTWNAFLSPMIYLNSRENFNVQVGLQMFQGIDGSNINWALVMAATTVSIIPILVLFFAMQKYFIPSNKADGVK